MTEEAASESRATKRVRPFDRLPGKENAHVYLRTKKGGPMAPLLVYYDWLDASKP